jgi:hypothetical protein
MTTRISRDMRRPRTANPTRANMQLPSRYTGRPSSPRRLVTTIRAVCQRATRRQRQMRPLLSSKPSYHPRHLQEDGVPPRQNGGGVRQRAEAQRNGTEQGKGLLTCSTKTKLYHESRGLTGGIQPSYWNIKMIVGASYKHNKKSRTVPIVLSNSCNGVAHDTIAPIVEATYIGTKILIAGRQILVVPIFYVLLGS